MAHSSADDGDTSEGRTPHYGERIPSKEWANFLAAQREAASDKSANEVPTNRPKALRRMVGGISFAMCMLGILVVFGFMATGMPLWSLIGAIPLLAGLAGIMAVRWRLPQSFRDADGPRVPRTANRWFWLPAGMALMGLASLVVAYLIPGLLAGRDEIWVRNNVVLWVEIGFVLLLMASLMTGLIALALWTTPDEDGALLRTTDYAQRRRERDRGPGYDSDWMRGRK